MKVTTADRLRQIMDERRLRQVDILRLCEPICAKFNLTLSKSDLSQFVHGKVTPGQWKISILARALNVSEAWLMGYDVPIDRIPDEERSTNEDALVELTDGAFERSPFTFHSPRSHMANEHITDEDQQLLIIYAKLNDQGKQALLDYANFLITKTEYLAEPYQKESVSVS